MVICLEQGADLHMSQLMPLPLLQYRSSIFLFYILLIWVAYAPNVVGGVAQW